MPDIPETWLDSQTVNTSTLTSSSFENDIAQLANGNILVTWNNDNASGDGSPPGFEVFGQLFDPLGVRIGTEFRVNQLGQNEDERDSSIVTLPGGGFIVIYHAQNLGMVGGSNILLEEFDQDGVSVNESGIVILDSVGATAPNYASPRGAASNDTSVLITYDKDDGGTGIYAKVYDPTTDTYGSEITVMTAVDTQLSDIAVLDNGNYVIAASRYATDSAVRFCILNSAGGTVLAPAAVAGTNTNADNDFFPSVTALAGGGFVIVWITTGIDISINYARYDNAGIPTGTGTVNTGQIGNFNNLPIVTGLEDGSFVVTYYSTIAHISATGTELGSFEFDSATGTFPEVTSLADGRFAVSYIRNGSSEVSMEILDTRDNANEFEVYGREGWQVGTVGDDVFSANADTVHGHTGNDTISQARGAGLIFGDAGDDILIANGNISERTYNGGTGTDTMDWSAVSNAGAAFNMAIGTAADGIGNVEGMVGFENLIGTNQNDAITGSSGANRIEGRDGNDAINAGYGLDTMIGGIGNDTYWAYEPTDLITETIGEGTNDRVISLGGYALAAGVEVEGLSALSATGITALNLFGNQFSQTITGNAGINSLSGGSAGGTDTLIGLAGDDVYRVFNSTDIIVETAGNGTADRVAAAISFVLAADDDIEFLNTSDGFATTAINLTGNALAQSIVGNAGANILSSGATGTADTINGLGGTDTYILFNTGDIIVEVAGGGYDRVSAAVDFNLATDDDIEALNTNNFNGIESIDLRGNTLSQEIVGNAGANTLNGLGGADTITGFNGADVFAFNSTLGTANIDIIVDFIVVDDQILLENAVFIGLAAGVLAATAFSSSLTGLALDASDRIMYETDTGFLWFDQDGTGGAFAGVQFADLASGLAMTAAEFAVV